MTTYDIDGRTVRMPVHVRDASAGTVLLEVDAAAQALLPEQFEVAETSPGRANLAVALVDYRDNDLGAYLEVGLILFVRPRSGGEEDRSSGPTATAARRGPSTWTASESCG